ncbi:carbohydrate ABC transporter permease [Natrarchaeobius sp. A-rgal3]|uniref:carbohydrate ABC transporter permease n=1 Tax=Natrarchaeobius versutus TaxID=1679078 RepID=UPI0035104BC6
MSTIEQYRERMITWRRTATFEKLEPYLIVGPVMALVGLFIVVPIFQAIYSSFFAQSFLSPDEQTFIGLENYVTIFNDPTLLGVIWNTVIWVVAGSILSVLLGFFVGWLLYEKVPYTSVAMGITLIPWVVPGIVGATVWRFMFSSNVGIINELGVQVGLLDSYVVVLGDPSTSLYGPLVAMVWRLFPLFALLTLTGLQSVDERLYEAAEIDGATPFEKFVFITLPQMKYVLAIGVLLMLIYVIRDFEMIWVMTTGGPGESSSTLPIMAYRTTFQEYQIGLGSAISTLLFGALAVFSWAYIYVYKQMEDDST